ncbi:MAG: hypothetical protein FWD25_13605 [Clostridia bacterium]|nr:hypothetical protein [Clostridia bacterium]
MFTMAIVAFLLLQPWKQPEEIPESATESLSQGAMLAPGAMLDQTITYLPCGHVVQRRVEAPAEFADLDRKGIENALPEYRVTAFSGKEVTMQRDLNIFCPDHWVLMPDAQGELCIWQNQMGEVMVRVRNLGIVVDDLPESAQNEVRIGKGFSSAEELEGWLEGVDG